METAVTEKNGGGCANAPKSKLDHAQKDGPGEMKASNDLPNAWKVNRETTGLPPSSANNIQSAKTLHSTNGTNGGNGVPTQGDPSSFHDKDSRAKPRYKYNKPAPKIVAPIVTDKEEDWPTLGLGPALDSKTASGLLGSNGTGLLNGCTPKNHRRSASTTDSPSTSSRTNSIIGQDDAERASIVSGEGGDNPNLDVDQIDGELSTKLRDECTFKSEDAELPKETNNNETRKPEKEIVPENKNKTRSGREKLKWKPLPLPNTPSRPMRPRRWEEKDSSARNGATANGPTRTSQSTITTFANSSQTDISQHGGTNATPSVQRGRGHNRSSVGRGGHHDYQGHDEEDDGHFVDYYEDKRRGYYNYGNGSRAYYGGRPRGGGGGRWQHPRGGGGASRSSRHEEEDTSNGTVRGSGSQSNHDGVETQENYHAGNGGGNSNSYAGAISNTNNRTGSSRGGDQNQTYTGKNSGYTDYPHPRQRGYAEVVAVSYPYDSAAPTIATTHSLIPVTGLTITTAVSVMDPRVLTSCSPSPSGTPRPYAAAPPMPYPQPSQSPVVTSPPGGMVQVGLPTTMEQVVDEQRLRTMVTKQIMYYLSEENLEQDFYLRRRMNAEGYIDIGILAGFHRLKGMTSNIALILEVILSCPDKFQVNQELTHVRPRLNPTMWPVPSENEPEQVPDPTDSALVENTVTVMTGLEPVVSYNTAEYPSVGYYSLSSANAMIGIGPENHGQVHSISSASSTSSLACTSASLSPGLLRPFRLNPDVPEFVPRGTYPNSPEANNQPTTTKPE